MEFHASKTRTLGTIGLGCVMVGASYGCTTLPSLTARMAGWIGVVFFGSCLVLLPVRFFRAGPLVVIDDAGIEDRRLGIGVIPWEDVRSLSIRSIRSQRFLCVDVADPRAYLSRIPRWRRILAAANERLGFTAVTIGFSGLTPGLAAAWAEASARADRLRGDGSD